MTRRTSAHTKGGTASPRPSLLGAIVLSAALASAAGVALASGGSAPSAAPVTSVTASASATVGASASAAQAPPPKPITATFPTTPSEPPNTEWESAPVLWSHIYATKDEPRIRCDVFNVREWLRLRCESPKETVNDKTDPATFGAVWGMAGDLAEVSANVVPLFKSMPEFRPGGKDEWAQKFLATTLAMGGRVEVTLPLRPKQAALIEIGRLVWEHGYSSSIEVPRVGLLLETAWAEGEPRPHVALGGVVVLE